MQELDLRNRLPKVVVADSLYGNHIFLVVFLLIKTVVALVRVRATNVFYEQPKPRKKGQKGAPAKHGARFKLSAPTRPADHSGTFLLG